MGVGLVYGVGGGWFGVVGWLVCLGRLCFPWWVWSLGFCDVLFWVLFWVGGCFMVELGGVVSELVCGLYCVIL